MIDVECENGAQRILGIPFLSALNSGNFSSTTTGKSSFLDQYSGSDFEDAEQQEGTQEMCQENQRFKEISLHFFTFSRFENALERQDPQSSRNTNPDSTQEEMIERVFRDSSFSPSVLRKFPTSANKYRVFV